MKTPMRFISTLMLAVTTLWGAHADVPSIKVGVYAQEVGLNYTTEQGLPSNNVRAIHVATNGDVYADTESGWAVFTKGVWKKSKAPKDSSLENFVSPSEYASAIGLVTEATKTAKGKIIVATRNGVLSQGANGFEKLTVSDKLGRQWATSDVRGVTVDSKGQLWVATLAGVAQQGKKSWTFYEGKDGLPYNDFTTAEAGPNGEVWFGTHIGAVRYDGEWHYRQGRRWLPNDDVRDIAVDKNGNAWFATAGGVGCIERRMMTLAEKADYLENDMDLIKRTEFGYTAEASLAVAGDKTSKLRHHDSDNDGLWTAMYGAGECFAYGATKDPKAKKRAKEVFEALRQLQKVVQGSSHEPPHGYIARTILPTSGPNPNDRRYERDVKKNKEDNLWKLYEPRWPTSKDGKWFWKSDTSSDELDGHYFFFPLYYDLVAETEEEKERAREVIRDLTDHMIKYNYQLVDHDGKTTRWGYYNPEALNHDGYWWVERGLKSLSMLSYLAVAEHMTGDQKYRDHMNILIKEHAYDTNAMHYKLQRGVGSPNHSDDEMAFMCFYNLMKYGKDEALLQKIGYSFYTAWAIEAPEMNPFFNFAYAAFGLDQTYTSPWGTSSIAPWDGWLEDSVTTLKGFELDRYNWRFKNSHRTDLVMLERQAALELGEPASRLRHGHRPNGKVFPVENRQFNHWNHNPWTLDTGGNGQGFANGTVFLLPYYMGLYHGFIEN